MVKIKYRFGKPTKGTIEALIKEYNNLNYDELTSGKNFHFSILWNKDGGQSLKTFDPEFEDLLVKFAKYIKEEYNLETTFNSKGLGNDYISELFFLNKDGAIRKISK